MFPIHHARSRTVSVPRRLPAILAVAALLTAFVLPSPAAAQPGATAVEGRTLAVVLQWLDGLPGDLGPGAGTPGTAEDPVATNAPLGCEIDPGGTPCPEESSVSFPQEFPAGPDREEPRRR